MKRILAYSIAAIIAAALICGALWRLNSTHFPERDQSPKPPATTAFPSNSVSANSQPSPSFTNANPGGADVTPGDYSAARKILKESLAKLGIKEMPPLEKHLNGEIASGDKSRILRAFHDAIYSEYWPASEVIPVLKRFLDDPNPFVRYLSAQDLLIIGDNSGYSALLALVQSDSPIDGIGADVRVQAAETLAQFRQYGATQSIYELYQKTKNGNLIADLVTLGSPQGAAATEERGYFSDAASLEFYGQAAARQFLPQINSTFYNTQNPDVKAAAAWDLATMTGNQDAISYLAQQAQLGLNNPAQAGSLNVRNAVKYLGSITTSQAKQALEAALGSADSMVVQTAAVNLVLNQGGSDKVNQMVAAELTGPPNPLGADMALNLAPQLLNDPRVQAAGQTFSRQDGSGAWRRYTVNRANWPVYSWVDSYVMKLNK